MERAGLRCLAAIDFNPEAAATLKANASGFSHLRADRVLEHDLTLFGPEAMADSLGVSKVDVIVGGPPCQGWINYPPNAKRTLTPREAA